MSGLEGKILDRYEVRELVGRGGMADVYLAFDPYFERDVAVKVFKREDEELLQRFVREARLMASLHHENLTSVYDTGEAKIDGSSHYYIVMPYLGGGNLRSRIRKGPIPLREACRCLRQIAAALDYIHKEGIIHRDIKSSNVLLDTDGRCYLADFGIARSNNDNTQMTSTGNVLGTVDYIAPEMFDVDYKADRRSDFYSLGVLLYEMVTGRLPFIGANQIAVVTMHVSQLPPAPSSIVPDLSPPIERVVLRALEKRPEARYPNAMALATAFCNAVAGRAMEQEQVVRQTVPHHTPLVLPPAPVYSPSSIPVSRSTGIHPAGQPGPTHVYPAYATYASPSHRPPPPDRTRGHILTIIALLALLAVIVPVSYVIWQMSHNGAAPTPVPIAVTTPGVIDTVTVAQATATPNTTATAQIVAATATQQAKNATATAIAVSTATAQAQASATAGVAQTAIATQPIYQDVLNNAQAQNTVAMNWEQADNKCAFQPDGYHVIASSGGAFVGCRESAQMFDNISIAVDMTINSGRSGGFFFRQNLKLLGAYSGYLFEVDVDGRYRITSASNFSTHSDYQVLKGWTSNIAIKIGQGAKNHLQVIARHNDLLFYINGVFLAPEIQNSSFSTGYIAFLATTDVETTSGDVAYSNLGVYAQP